MVACKLLKSDVQYLPNQKTRLSSVTADTESVLVSQDLSRQGVHLQQGMREPDQEWVEPACSGIVVSVDESHITFCGCIEFSNLRYVEPRGELVEEVLFQAVSYHQSN